MKRESRPLARRVWWVIALALWASAAAALEPVAGPGAAVGNSVRRVAASAPRTRLPRLVGPASARPAGPGTMQPRPTDSPRGTPDESAANAAAIGSTTQHEYRRVLPATLPWQTEPAWVHTVRRYRSGGIPVVHLWEGSRALVAIGVNPHGVPGIYLSQKIGE